MRVCVGSPGTFSTRKCAVGDARDLRQVRDRHHLRALGEPAQRLGDARARSTPPMPASISSKTIVSPPATAAIASATRDSSPPEAVSATGAERQPGVRPDQEHDLVATRSGRARARAARPGTRPRPSRRPAAPRRPPRRTAPPQRAGAPASAAATLVERGLAPPRAPARARSTGSCAVARALELRPRVAPRLEQLVERLRRGKRRRARRSARAALDLPRPGPGRPRASRGTRRRSLAHLASRSSSSRSSSPAAASSGASRRAAPGPLGRRRQ